MIRFHQIKLKKKKIWPVDEKYVEVKGSKPVKVNHSIALKKLGEQLQLELWEYDNFLSSKCIGTFTFTPTEAGGPFTTDLKMTSDEFAKYTLEWEVNRKKTK